MISIQRALEGSILLSSLALLPLGFCSWVKSIAVPGSPVERDINAMCSSEESVKTAATLALNGLSSFLSVYHLDRASTAGTGNLSNGVASISLFATLWSAAGALVTALQASTFSQAAHAAAVMSASAASFLVKSCVKTS